MPSPKPGLIGNSPNVGDKLQVACKPPASVNTAIKLTGPETIVLVVISPVDGSILKLEAEEGSKDHVKLLKLFGAPAGIPLFPVTV